MPPTEKLKRVKSNTILLVSYCLCLITYFAFFTPELVAAASFPNILIAPIMAFGSFVAGSTFLGGGAVAFPALTKILYTDPVTAKTFSLAIQSVGMTSAAIYIFLRVRDLPLRFLAFYIGAASLGMALSLSSLEKLIPSTDLRIGFTLFIVCFLAVYIRALSTSDSHTLRHIHFHLYDYKLIIVCGFLGGIISGLLGSGADLIGFCLLTLYFRLDIKLATQSSVVLMAGTSVAGMLQQLFLFNSVNEEVIQLWYIAAPVVLLGAPLGAVFCRRINEKKLILFICAIVLTEVISTILLVPIEKSRIVYYLAAAGGSLAIFAILKHFAFFKHRD